MLWVIFRHSLFLVYQNCVNRPPVRGVQSFQLLAYMELLLGGGGEIIGENKTLSYQCNFFQGPYMWGLQKSPWTDLGAHF